MKLLCDIEHRFIDRRLETRRLNETALLAESEVHDVVRGKALPHFADV